MGERSYISYELMKHKPSLVEDHERCSMLYLAKYRTKLFLKTTECYLLVIKLKISWLGCENDSRTLLAAGDDEKNEVEKQVKNLDRSISSHCSTIQRESDVDVGVGLHKNEVDESEEEQIASAEKQSVSVDAISSSQKNSVAIEVTF